MTDIEFVEEELSALRKKAYEDSKACLENYGKYNRTFGVRTRGKVDVMKAFTQDVKNLLALYPAATDLLNDAVSQGEKAVRVLEDEG